MNRRERNNSYYSLGLIIKMNDCSSVTSNAAMDYRGTLPITIKNSLPYPTVRLQREASRVKFDINPINRTIFAFNIFSKF